MYNVVMAIDASEARAKAQADNISKLPLKKDAIKITIVHVFSDNPRGESTSQVSSVRHTADQLQNEGYEVEIRGSGGDPSTEILDIAEEIDADLVSVAGRKRSPSGKAIFGSVSQSILLQTDRPVIISGRKK
jgi:nucleotide-binding universal stress UspA family protein